jgi:caa(3)-type oxidase subunit IV
MADHADHAGHHPNYRNIYITLLVLLVISILGPELGIFWVTLVTAFGIALIKATMVIRNFMHLKDERALIGWVLGASLLLMFLFFFGIAPEVMKHEGTNWENLAAKEYIDAGLSTAGEEEHH